MRAAQTGPSRDDCQESGNRHMVPGERTHTQEGRWMNAVNHPRLLVVDDDAELRELIQTYLSRQGFEVLVAGDGEQCDEVLSREQVDLIILDLMLPGEDGLSIAKRLKASCEIPIVMLSAQGDAVDRIVGLEVGADDYLGKPFNPRELLARVRAVLRRVPSVRPLGDPLDHHSIIRFGRFALDLHAHRLLREGQAVALTTGEFDLLAVLAQHPNRVLDRDRILDLLTGAERSPFDRSIDVRVTRLRGKIEDEPANPRFIRTIWGKGYLFSPEGV